MRYYSVFVLLVICLNFISCKNDNPAPQNQGSTFTLTDIHLDGRPISYTYSNSSITPEIEVSFSARIDKVSAKENIVLSTGTTETPLTFSFTHGDSTVVVSPESSLNYWDTYFLTLKPAIASVAAREFGSTIKIKIITEIDQTDKFPVVSDSILLDLVQRQTFKYFYDYAEPNSGMARERNGSGDLITTGGSGFGLMAIIVGIERNFITREQGTEQLDKILTFLEKADRFHGAWSHWINGGSGKVIPFSTKDNGGDLVETSFLVQGLITFRQYLNGTDATEKALIDRINTLWNGVEWDWYRKDSQNVLYWHWSPTYNWDMNFPLYGYFEEQITYILAAASNSHTISKNVYANGFGKNGAIKTGNTYYGYTLPLGEPAPLFWVQYSYLGMDPHFSDDYANYWEQNVNASLINYAYCVANPKKYIGYGENCWGLTASDIPNGYGAQSPTNDIGVITPTAALSSFPYTPTQSMKALKFFYYKLGDKVWGNYGFYDAFNITEGWAADSYLAIDQGPIVVMIENYRTGLLWNLFMSAPEIKDAQTKLGFTN